MTGAWLCASFVVGLVRRGSVRLTPVALHWLDGGGMVVMEQLLTSPGPPRLPRWVSMTGDPCRQG